MVYGPAPWSTKEKYDKARATTVLRNERMAAAKEKGTHTPLEWQILMSMFNRCVWCGVTGVTLSKDHIIAVAYGGCDCIANLQPLCVSCNTAAVSGDDYRDNHLPDWSVRLVDIMGRIFR